MHSQVARTAADLPVDLQKYWNQRYKLFSRYDDGIWMDHESWFSVTPEAIALQIAQELEACNVGVVCDAFCGAGGNAIAFALYCEHVIACEIDPIKLECARHNAEIYGVADKITFLLGDFFELVKDIQADCVFMSPPWGGPSYNTQVVFDINTMQPYSAQQLMQAVEGVTDNVVLYLPRTSSQRQIACLRPGPVELQYLKLKGSMKAMCAYFGDLASEVEQV